MLSADVEPFVATPMLFTTASSFGRNRLSFGWKLSHYANRLISLLLLGASLVSYLPSTWVLDLQYLLFSLIKQSSFIVHGWSFTTENGIVPSCFNHTLNYYSRFENGS